MASLKDNLRRWSRTIHRELSFFLSGMVLIYAISGLFMNHRDTFNPHYSVTRIEQTLSDVPAKDEAPKETLFDFEPVEVTEEKKPENARKTSIRIILVKLPSGILPPLKLFFIIK